jgi:hypothetical protein
LTGGTTQARGMAASLLKYANREAVARALTERGYPVSRATVNRWAGGKEMPEIAGQLIAELFMHPDTAKRPPPWAEAIADDVSAIRRGVESEAVGLAALRALLEAIQAGLLPPDDDPADDPAPPQTVGRRGR